MGEPIEKEIFKEQRSPETEKKRRLPKPSLMAIGLITALALGTVNLALNVNGNFHGAFPGQQSINVVATYSFGTAPGQQVLAAGSIGNFDLKLTYAGTIPTNLAISFNATNPEQPNYSTTGRVGQGNFVGFYTVAVSNTVIAPINGQGAVNCSNVVCTVTVQAVHGLNDYQGSITVRSDVTVDSFSLSWFADAAP